MEEAQKSIRQGKKYKSREFSTDDYKVNIITIYELPIQTRGGLSIGSSLEKVLETFGDTASRTVARTPFKTVQCEDVYIRKFPENRTSLLMKGEVGYFLTIDYSNDGIAFHFKVDGSPLTVYAISITQKEECDVIVELEHSLE